MERSPATIQAAIDEYRAGWSLAYVAHRIGLTELDLIQLFDAIGVSVRTRIPPEKSQVIVDPWWLRGGALAHIAQVSAAAFVDWAVPYIRTREEWTERGARAENREHEQPSNRALSRRTAQWTRIAELHKRGLGATKIARVVQLSRRRVQQYLASVR